MHKSKPGIKIFALLSDGSLHVDQLIEKTGYPAARVLETLLELELQGLLHQADRYGRLHVFYQDALNYDVKYSYGYFSGFLPASSIVRTNPF